jgi:transposase InsO family protein
MKYEFIKKHSEEFPVSRICQVMEVSKSGYYAWLKCPKSKRAIEDDFILERIIDSHDSSGGTYGSPRVYQDLKDEGINCGIHKVERLMHVNGICAKTVKKFKATTNSEHSYPVADNILDRNFVVEEKNKVWVSDITYIETSEGWLYLCIIMDLFSRMIVGWSMANHMRAELVCDAFNMACMRRNPGRGFIFHSDRGIQYASSVFRDLIKPWECIQSMSRKGNCWDNACAESFFHSLKTEEVYFHKYRTRDEAKKSIFKYIEVFYNRKRRHSHLGYKSPEVFERLGIKKSA